MLRNSATPPLMRQTIDYLITNGHVGYRNAVRLEVIVRWLVDGHHIPRSIKRPREHFQHEVLVPSRQGRLFIGTYGSFGRGGIFLIRDRADAQKTFDFYENRIRREREHLTNLEALMGEAF